MRLKIAVAILVLGLPMAALAQTKDKGAVRTNFGTCTEQQIISCRTNVTAAKQARGGAPLQRGEQQQILRSCLAKLGCTQ